MTPKEEAILAYCDTDSMDELNIEAVHVPLKFAMQMYDLGEMEAEESFTKGYEAGEDARNGFYRPIIEALGKDIETAKDEFVKTLRWSDEATETEKTLVIGNLNGFIGYLHSIASTGFTPQEIDKAGMFVDELVNRSVDETTLCRCCHEAYEHDPLGGCPHCECSMSIAGIEEAI